ncbi:50S ribosomal protein L11 methyltransferase [Hoeflea sp. YIM 152468]|uniref:50S ribosomal protein L11 methyltransferase n=1 Tax=Hoeflea sp. YIM 152468 TaxID=3031759 RepID=UPI0023DB0F47|nr:50S ribosomal protein L11 methyltransferase [Hoeflea sp. YIM 152468]MDF1609547.1 50S ribosomal protein L11 methyltransferase [Hoeflea sp. YIM 152468]
MSDHRYYFRTGEAGARLALDLLDSFFEDEGLPVATMEIDEDRGLWEVSVYAAGDPDDNLKSRIRTVIGAEFAEAEIGLEVFGETDWIAKSLEGLKPVRAGRFVVHGAHDRATVRSHELAIELEAGQAFGTGHHGTTAGCLEMIERVMRAHPGGPRGVDPVLDLGTGSGVLAIAAARLGPVQVLATDIDPVATRVARDNVRHNQAAAQIACVTATGFHSTAFSAAGPFGLIIANILARPLMHMAPDIKRHLAPGGSVILSGILANQRWQVLAAFSGQGMRHVATLWRNGWVTIHLK